MNDDSRIPDVAYHYCSIDSLKAIVESKTFRLGNVFFMNDYMEVEWFKRVFREVVDSGQSAPARFRQALFGQLSEGKFDHVYCGCFSAERDDLSQWRGYADNGRGVAIGTDLTAVKTTNEENMPTLRCEWVEYDHAQQRSWAQDAFDRAVERLQGENDIAAQLSRAAFLYADLRMWAPKFKNPKFYAEREIRLIADDSRTFSFQDHASYNAELVERLGSDIEFYVRNGSLVPFVEVQLPADTIREVWLGPRFGRRTDQAALELFLTKHDVNATVRRSEASYR